MSHTKVYYTWSGMRERCGRAACDSYPRYGGRGIRVCARWQKSFQSFLDDMGLPPKGTTLDRIDNNKGYEPGNCRWATPKQQARNRTNNVLYRHKGKNMTLPEWSEIVGVSWRRLHDRIHKGGWSTSKALTTPSFERGKYPRAKGECRKSAI